MKVKAKVAGYVLGCVAAATYGLNPLFALPLYADGCDTISVLMWRYLIAVSILGLIIALRPHESFRVTPRRLPSLIVLGVLMALSSVCLFASYGYMAAGIASTILFVYPIMVAVIMLAFFHEHFSWITIGSIAVASAGILLLYKGEDGSTLSAVGTLLVILSALTYAIYLVGINHTGLGGMAALTLTFWVIFFGAVTLGVCVAWQGGITTPRHTWLWVNALCLGLLPTAVSLLCTTAAITRIGSTPVAILGALEPVTAVVVGCLVFSEPLTGRILTGIMLIVAAVIAVIAAQPLAHLLRRLHR